MFDPSPLREARRARGLTTTDVAVALHRERSMVSYYELGRCPPNAHTLGLWLAYLGVNPAAVYPTFPRGQS